MEVSVVFADYNNPQHGDAIVELMNAYALDPMGGGEALSQEVQSKLFATLATVPHAFSVIAFVDGKTAGLINCFEGFSTFKCKPLINIHDVIVSQEFRGYGVSQRMLEKVEERAIALGCCKMTLEVLEGNRTAQNSYRKFGFAGYELDPEMGKALFWQKSL